ncbi:MAG: enoyl-CoA hydratase/isomerase family protein [Polyangiaceae bacterium]|nr:enoyl-CoA hydratase/isomerase family protein [Polyangiaceae bacterium]
MNELAVTRAGAVATWTITRGHKRNALGLDLIRALSAACRDDAERGTTAVVLTAEPSNGVFCAGFDRDVLASLAAAGATTESAASPLHALFDELSRAPFSLVTAITGAALGGGVELALLGDVRIAARGARFTLPPARLGIVYPDVGLSRLALALGRPLLGAMLATAAPITAERLLACGALWSLSDAPVEDATAIADAMATLPAAGRLGNRDALREARACSCAGRAEDCPAGVVSG